MNKRGLSGWVVPFLVFLCLTVAAASAEAYNISGTIYNGTGSPTSRVYVVVMWQGGGSTGYGTSLAGIPSGGSQGFTIQGVPSGYYQLFAFSDTTDTGRLHVNDPHLMGGSFFLNGNQTVPGLVLPPATSTAPPAVDPDSINVGPCNSGALVMWDPPTAQGGGIPSAEYADAYVLYWGTSQNPGNGSTALGERLVPATGNYHVFLGGLTQGTSLYFTVKAVNKAGSVYSSTSSPTTIAAPTGNATVTGRVYFDAATYANKPLYVALQGNNYGGFYIAQATASSSPQSWSATGVQPDTYSVYTILDPNSDGFSQPAGYVTGAGVIGDGASPTFTVLPGATGAVAPDVTLAASDSRHLVTTQLQSDSTYQLRFTSYPALKRLVGVTVNAGPSLGGPIDLGLSLNGGDTARFGDNGGIVALATPVAGDTYSITARYADGSSVPVTAQVTGVFNSRPTIVFPGDGAATTAINSGSSLFAWRGPTQAGYYDYSLWLNGNNSFIWNSDNNGSTPATTLAIPYNGDGYAQQSTLLGGTYTWTISVRDALGNQAQNQATFTPQAGGPSITGFTPAGGGGGTQVTITGSGFTGASAVKFGNVAASSFTVNSPTQIIATVPTNGNAPVGPILVTVGGVTGASPTSFQTTVNYTSSVVDASGAALSGATVTLEGSYPSVSTPTDGAGNFTLPVPAAVPYMLRFAKSGKRDVLSARYSNASDVTSTNPYKLHTDASLPTGFSVDDKGLIWTRLYNPQTGATMAGATLTATSFLHPDRTYPVYYSASAGSADMTSSGSTQSDGRFAVPNVDEGDIVTVKASLPGYASASSTYQTHIGVINQGSVQVVPVPTISANPAGGTLISGQQVTLTIGNPFSGDQYYIYYTTDGGDPSLPGSNRTAYLVPAGGTASTNVTLPTGNVTLRFCALNASRNFAVSPVVSANYTVTGIPTTLSVSLDQNSVSYGNWVLATVKVTPAQATGPVQFMLDGAPYEGQVFLNSGTASIYISAAVSGLPHVVSASYGGSSSYAPSVSSANPSFSVTPIPVSVFLNPSMNPATYGQGLSFYAFVSPGDATGTVQFQLDGVNFGGPVAVTAGSAASPVISNLAQGDHNIGASFTPSSGNYAPGSALGFIETVNGIWTDTSVSLSQTQVSYGTPVTATATVSPAQATGTVQFMVDGAPFGAPVTLNSGSAGVSISLPAGISFHTVSASYSGSASYAASSSAFVPSFVVNPLLTSVSVVSSANPSNSGQGVSFTATVTPAGAAGTVQFLVDGVAFGAPVTLAAGKAYSASTTTLAPGSRTVSASFTPGNGNYSGSLSGGYLQTVNAVGFKVPASGNYFGTLSAALAAMADNSTVTLDGQAMSFTGGFILNRPVNLTLLGGFDAGFLSNTGGTTVLVGGLMVRNGSLRVQKLVLR